MLNDIVAATTTAIKQAWHTFMALPAEQWLYLLQVIGGVLLFVGTVFGIGFVLVSLRFIQPNAKGGYDITPLRKERKNGTTTTRS